MRSVRFILFGVGLAATIDYNGLNNPTTKIIAMSCFVLLFVVSFSSNRDSNRSRIFTPILFWYVLACIVNLIYAFLFDREVDVVNQEIALPLMVCFSSYSLFDVEPEELQSFFLPVCLFSAYCAIKTILKGIGSFSIYTFDDLVLAKNQIGAAYTTMAIICAVFVSERKAIWLRLSYCALSVINILPAVYFGCRTAMLSYVVIVLFVIYTRYQLKSIIVIPVLLLIVLAIGGDYLVSLLNASFIGERDVNDMESLTNGRYSRLFESFNYFLDHPLMGFYGSVDSYNEMPHNAHMTLLFRLTKWGIIGAIPYLVLYFHFFAIAIRSVKQGQILAASVLLYAYVESLGEYAPPFGPGSSFIPVFFIVGYFLNIDRGKQ